MLRINQTSLAPTNISYNTALSSGTTITQLQEAKGSLSYSQVAKGINLEALKRCWEEPWNVENLPFGRMIGWVLKKITFPQASAQSIQQASQNVFKTNKMALSLTGTQDTETSGTYSCDLCTYTHAFFHNPPDSVNQDPVYAFPWRIIYKQPLSEIAEKSLDPIQFQASFPKCLIKNGIPNYFNQVFNLHAYSVCATEPGSINQDVDIFTRVF